MDNFTHSLTGWAIGQAGLKTTTRKGLAALILGANMPDIDVVFGAIPWEPLAMHRGATHSLVFGVILMPPLLAGLLWLLDRWQIGRGATFKSGLDMRFRWLLGLAYIGTLTHPMLDMLTTYSVQLLSPFSGAWFHADGLFIIDVWLWSLLSLAIAASRDREKLGRPWPQLPQAALGIMAVYIAINLAISQRAVAAVRGWAGERAADAIFTSPPPVLFHRRDIVWREGACYRRSSYDPLGAGLGPVGACEPTNIGDPAVQEAIRRDPELQGFMRWSVLPQANVERGRCAVRVVIGDARYGARGRSRLGRETTIATGAPGCPDTA